MAREAALPPAIFVVLADKMQHASIAGDAGSSCSMCPFAVAYFGACMCKTCPTVAGTSGKGHSRYWLTYLQGRLEWLVRPSLPRSLSLASLQLQVVWIPGVVAVIAVIIAEMALTIAVATVIMAVATCIVAGVAVMLARVAISAAGDTGTAAGCAAVAAILPGVAIIIAGAVKHSAWNCR